MPRSRLPALGLVLALFGCSSHVQGAATEVDPGSTGPGAKAHVPTTRPATDPKVAVEALPKEEVSSRIQAWLAGATAPLRYTPMGGRLVYSSQTKSYRFDQGGVRLLVSFERPLPAAVTVAELQRRFRFAVVDEVPLPIEAPGWTIRLATPQSSTESGFTIESFEGGRLRAKLDWRFFAVIATRADCQAPADAPMPDRCFLSIERDMPFTISLDAPLADSGTSS